MTQFRLFLATCLAALLTASTALCVNLNEGFEDTQFPPPGWQSLQNADGTYKWIRQAGTTYTHSNTTGGAAAGAEYLPSGQVSSRWLITPRLRPTAGTNSLAYWVKSDLSVAANDTLYIMVSTTDALPASFTTVLVQYTEGTGGYNSSWAQKTNSLAAYNDMDIYVAFVHRDEGAAGRSVFLDDMTGPEIFAPPYQATAPSPANLAYGVAENTNISWTNSTTTATVDLYLSTSYDDVANSVVGAQVVGNQAVSSYDPPVDLSVAEEYYWKVVSRNAYGDTHGDIRMFATTGMTPLSGSYDIGGATPEFPNFSVAVSALYNRGISDAVTFNVWGGDYDDRVWLVGPVTGASADDTIKFVDASGTARLRLTRSTASTDGVIHLENTGFFIFDGIDVMLATQDLSTYICVRVTANADNNIVRNATLTGAGIYPVTDLKYGIYTSGTACDNNVYDNLDFRRHSTCIWYSGSGTNKHSSNVVQNCSFDNYSTQAALLSYTPNIHFRNNDIQQTAAGFSSVVGVLIDDQASGDNVYVYDNEFHNFYSSGSPVIIKCDGTAGSISNIYNNLVYDLHWTGTSASSLLIANTWSGTVNLSFNSIYLNDQTGADPAGTIRGYYHNSSTATVISNIQNNIFYFADANNPTRAIYGTTEETYEPDILNHNAYYNAGGADFKVFDVGSDEYVTVEDLRNGEGLEVNGVEGDPGFLSPTDLHIDVTVGTVADAGTPIAGVDEDFDGDDRDDVSPDIGADEYDYIAPPDDYRVREIVDPLALYAEFTLYNVDVWVENFGSDDQVDVPVRLFFNDVQQGGDILVSLLAGESDVISFPWTTPASPDAGYLEAQCFLPGDVDPTNDSARVNVQIVGQPMHGSYDLGGGDNDYATFGEVATDLSLRGMDGAVTINVYTQVYEELVRILPVQGMSALNTLTFVGVPGTLDANPVVTAASSPVVWINGGDYVIWDGIDVIANASSGAITFTISNDADNNIVRNCAIVGNSLSSSSAYGIQIGATSDNNLLENNTLTNSYFGIGLVGAAGTECTGNEISGNAIVTSKYSITTKYQIGALVHDNDITPGFPGAATELRGVYVDAQSTGHTVYVYNNEIHGFVTNNIAVGVYADAGSGLAVIHDNFFYDWRTTTATGRAYAINALDPANVYFNSIRINDVASTGAIRGLFMGATSAVVNASNNIIEIDEAVSACHAIFDTTGTLTSDYNAFYGTGAGFVVGNNGANRITLNDWQTSSGQDANSLFGAPGFFSPTNLHIQGPVGLVNGEGVGVGLTEDIDGETRGSPPDIGADEYTYAAVEDDYGITELIGIAAAYPTLVPVVIQAKITNTGTADQIDAPVRLFYNNVQGDEQLVDLTAGQTATVNFNWTPPIAGYLIAPLKIKAFLAGDLYVPNDSLQVNVTVYGGPMSGIYDLGGGGMDFETFAQAVDALKLRGVDGAVTIDVYEGQYIEGVEITAITGTNLINTVTFRNHPGALDDVVELVSLVNQAAVKINDADFITFDGINVRFDAATEYAFEILGTTGNLGADYITIKNLSITGWSASNTDVQGITLHMDGNDNCLVDNVVINGCCYGLRCETGSTANVALEFRNCQVNDASYGVYLERTTDALVHDNDIRPASINTNHVYGIYMSITGNTGARIYNNLVHDLRTTDEDMSNYVNAILVGGTNTMVYNNFIYGFACTAGDPDIAAIRNGSSTTSYIYHNSILIDANQGAAEIAALRLGGSTAFTTAYNNTIVIEDQLITSYGIWRSSGTISASDYNNIYSTDGQFVTGIDGTTPYVTLQDWIDGTAYDDNSVAGDPGYVSNSDLHIQVGFDLLSGAGIALAEVTDDIDGDPRLDPPDIGADEFAGTPDAPTDMTIILNVATDDIEVRWSAVPGANSYDVYAGDTEDFALEPANFLGSTGSTLFLHVDQGLAADPIKFYKVVSSLAAPPAAARSHPGSARVR